MKLTRIHNVTFLPLTVTKLAYGNDLAIMHYMKDWKPLEEALSQNITTLSTNFKTGN